MKFTCRLELSWERPLARIIHIYTLLAGRKSDTINKGEQRSKVFYKEKGKILKE